MITKRYFCSNRFPLARLTLAQSGLNRYTQSVGPETRGPAMPGFSVLRFRWFTGLQITIYADGLRELWILKRGWFKGLQILTRRWFSGLEILKHGWFTRTWIRLVTFERQQCEATFEAKHAAPASDAQQRTIISPARSMTLPAATRSVSCCESNKVGTTRAQEETSAL